MKAILRNFIISISIVAVVFLAACDNPSGSKAAANEDPANEDPVETASLFSMEISGAAALFVADTDAIQGSNTFSPSSTL
jgi:hypothetical protein